jgi:hypothetical protein
MDGGAQQVSQPSSFRGKPALSNEPDAAAAPPRAPITARPPPCTLARTKTVDYTTADTAGIQVLAAHLFFSYADSRKDPAQTANVES